MNFFNVLILFGALASVSCGSLLTGFKEEWENFKVSKFIVKYSDTMKQLFLK